MKELFLLTALFTGLTSKSFAGTGNASYQIEFVLVILGFLLIVAILLAANDYLQKNGKAIVQKAITFLKKKTTLLRNHLKKQKSDYLEQSYY